MRIQSQLIKHDPAKGAMGDCQRTCVAVILGLHASEVPHFCDDPLATRDDESWWSKRQDHWLAERGLACMRVAYHPDTELDQVMEWTSRQSPMVPMILLGRSALGVNHVVVVLNGEIVCDPSGNGIVGPPTDGDPWEVASICVGANWESHL